MKFVNRQILRLLNCKIFGRAIVYQVKAWACVLSLSCICWVLLYELNKFLILHFCLAFTIFVVGEPHFLFCTVFLPGRPFCNFGTSKSGAQHYDQHKFFRSPDIEAPKL